MSVRTPGRRATRWGFRLGTGALALGLGWLLACWAALQHPRVDEPAPSDALFVLGPHDRTRMAEAFRLMDEGVAPVLVVATPRPRATDTAEDLQEREFCAGNLSYEVVCFEPDPSTTQGEAMRLRELAAERGWNRVSALTFRQHVPRSRLILGRCFEGDLDVLAVDYGLGPLGVLRQFRHESGGFVKAWLTPGCDQQLPGKPKSLG